MSTNNNQLQNKNGFATEPSLTPIEIISARNLVVHHQNKMLKKVVLGLLGALAVSTLLNFHLGGKEPQDLYFATSPTGSITKIEPMNQPMLSNAQVSAFAVEAVTETMSVSFVDYEKNLSESQEYFRPDAFRTVLDTLRNAGFLKEVVDGFYVATATPIEAPLIVREGDRMGTYAWEVKFPVAIKLQGKDGAKSVAYNANVIVERAPAHLRVRNLAVTRLVLTTR